MFNSSGEETFFPFSILMYIRIYRLENQTFNFKALRNQRNVYKKFLKVMNFISAIILLKDELFLEQNHQSSY